ncbi:hypothetical protein AL527_18800 [Pseudomonas fulva]|nr:hypothetical protein AL527_18800 [Pseudomonas fulva]HCP30894.1 hypothetical protein [Pseudomonas sp.]
MFRVEERQGAVRGDSVGRVKAVLPTEPALFHDIQETFTQRANGIVRLMQRGGAMRVAQVLRQSRELLTLVGITAHGGIA